MRRCIEPFARCWCQHHNLTSALRKTCNQAARRGYVLSAWFRVTEQTRFADFNAIKAAFPAADYVAPLTIFDIGGNKYRLVAAVHYRGKRVYVRFIGTHRDYDSVDARTV